MEVHDLATSLPALLEIRATETPDNPALYRRVADSSWSPFSWKNLWQDAVRLAAQLRTLGISTGDVLAIQLPVCPEWQLAELAGLLAGAVVVGVETEASSDHVRSLFAHCQPKVLITQDSASRERIPLPVRESLKAIVVLDGEPDLGHERALHSWQALLAAAPPRPRLDWPLPTRDDPAAFILTSGSTGQPKVIRYTHGQFLVACHAIADALSELEQGDTTICWLPLTHMFQRMLNFVAIVHGVATFYLSDPREILACASEVRPSYLIGVPRFYEKLYGELQHRPDRFVGWRDRLKFMITGSAPIAVPLLEHLHNQGFLVLEGYGLTENTVPMAVNRMRQFRFGSVGQLFPQNEYRFEDDGELLVRGPGLFTGYWQEPRSDERWTNDGFYRTGDCGYLDADGFLYLTGRKSEIIKTSTGRRIAPSQIEAAYKRCPYLDQVVVVGNGRKHLAALVSLDAAALRQGLRDMGFSPPPEGELASSSQVHALLEEELRELSSTLAPHERVRKVAILAPPLTVAAGELTSTMKPRRDEIEATRRELIEQLYRESDPLPQLKNEATSESSRLILSLAPHEGTGDA